MTWSRERTVSIVCTYLAGRGQGKETLDQTSRYIYRKYQTSYRRTWENTKPTAEPKRTLRLGWACSEDPCGFWVKADLAKPSKGASGLPFWAVGDAVKVVGGAGAGNVHWLR